MMDDVKWSDVIIRAIEENYDISRRSGRGISTLILVGENHPSKQTSTNSINSSNPLYSFKMVTGGIAKTLTWFIRLFQLFFAIILVGILSYMIHQYRDVGFNSPREIIVPEVFVRGNPFMKSHFPNS